MTQVFDDKGNVTPVTILEVTPLTITQIKTVATDGYNAVQVGYGVKKEKNINKALKGHFKGLGNFRHIKEFRIEDDKDVKSPRGPPPLRAVVATPVTLVPPPVPCALHIPLFGSQRVLGPQQLPFTQPLPMPAPIPPLLT